jgi:hypothetical protein
MIGLEANHPIRAKDAAVIRQETDHPSPKVTGSAGLTGPAIAGMLRV